MGVCMMSKEPFVKKVDTKKYLTLSFFCQRNDFRVCPNCGCITILGADKLNDLTTKERIDFVFDNKFKIHLGLCSDSCAKEFLGGLYDVYK
jgi:hypothetical protein